MPAATFVRVLRRKNVNFKEVRFSIHSSDAFRNNEKIYALFKVFLPDFLYTLKAELLTFP